MTTKSSTYAFDNAAAPTGARFSGLEGALDGVTARHLERLPVEDGWSCLEIGAGGGSIARWLADRVGPTGRVLATDVNLAWFAGGPANLEARVHDIVHDPLPDAAFDLIHARLVLVHLPERDQVTERLVRALRPGGWLVLEEFDSVLPYCALEDTDRERLVNRVAGAVVELLRRHGADTTYARELPWRLRAAGLVDVGGSAQFDYATGGSPAAWVLRANLEQVGDTIVEIGLASRCDVESFITVMEDPDLILHLPLFVSAWGRRP